MHEIVVVDYGSQYTPLLARRIRELGVFSRIVDSKRFEITKDTKGVILSGGPQSVYERGSLKLPEKIDLTNVPTLGICYGMHLLIESLGGRISAGSSGEYGATIVELEKDELFEGVPDNLKVLMSHGDSVLSLSDDCEVIAKSSRGIVAGFRKDLLRGLQFHPEVCHTEFGKRILANFVRGICKAEGDWSIKVLEKDLIEGIKRHVGEEKVIAGLSGGVDSSVAAVITSRAIGTNLTGVFVDHGLMREREADEILSILRELRMNVRVLDAKDLFFSRLKGVVDPEQKRRVIGEAFIEVFEREARKLGATFLLQGTIMSDVIESGSSSGTSDKIKSHHNVGGLPERMALKLLEPLRQLFKDEVRLLGKSLGIPDGFLNRHPFPGPGLGVRILGEVTPEKAQVLQRADRIFLETLRSKKEDRSSWQAFAVLLPISSVGVKGDRRSYGYVIALRAVDSSEGMTATSHEFPWHVLKEAASRIVGEIPQVSRVVYDLTDKPPATIEWE